MRTELRRQSTANLFSLYIGLIRKRARKLGYAVAVHGSMRRDCDLVAIPWTEEAADADVLAEAIRDVVHGHFATKPTEGPEAKPHGRLAWSIYFQVQDGWPVGPYFDLSVTPKEQSL